MSSQLLDMLNISVNTEIHNMNKEKHFNGTIESANIVLAQLRKSALSYQEKIAKVQKILINGGFAEANFFSSLEEFAIQINGNRYEDWVSYERIMQEIDRIINLIVENYREISCINTSLWKEWDTNVNCIKWNGKAVNKWNLIGCAIDGFNLDSFMKITRGIISCSLLTEQTLRFYNDRKLALLYPCTEQNTIIMCNNDLNTGTGHPDKIQPLSSELRDFYKTFYASSFLATGNLPEMCNPGNGIMNKVLPLDFMRKSVVTNASCNACNEIVLRGDTRPYGILCFSENLDHAKTLQEKLKLLGWDLSLLKINKEHELV